MRASRQRLRQFCTGTCTVPGAHVGWMLRIIGAPTLGSRERDEHNGFNEIAIHREGEECNVVVTIFGRQGQSWLQKQRYEFRPGEAGG
jgi:hypothetical protein